jgi:signal transduction histidine kinase/ligand-binding sensor domain-containing protein/CheY-like chemotaxis protein
MLSSYLLSVLLAASAPASAASMARPVPVGAAPTVLTAQFRRFGLADGLPSSAINAVVQDAQGYLWFGGTGGLSRYDGVEFKSYVHQPDRPDSLGGSFIDQLVAAPDGRLWIGTGDNGLDRLDPRSGRFEHWRHDPADPGSLSGDVVYALALAANGTLWIGTEHGLDRLSADGQRLTHEPFLPPDNDPTLRSGKVSALLAEADGSVWIGTYAGALARRRPDGSLQRIVLAGAPNQRNQIWRIEGGGGDIRVGTQRGLFRVDPDGVARPVFSEQTLAPEYVFASARDRAGRLWLATVHGVVLDDPASGLHRFHGQPLLLGGLPGEWVWRVLADREGGMWFTFYDGGVAYLAPGWENFTRYTHVPDDPQSLRDARPTALSPSLDGQLWVGSHGQIDKLDPATGKAEHVLDGLPNEVTSLLEDQHGLWLVRRGALQRYADGKLSTIDPERTMIERPINLISDAAGMLYVSVSGHGLVRIDPQSMAITPVPFDPQVHDIDQLSVVAEVHDGVPWYSNHEGLLHWNARSAQMEFVPGVRRGDGVNALAFDALGFWLARSEVLEHYRWRDGVARQDRVIGNKDGWPALVVSGLWPARDGQLWILSLNGLWRFDPAHASLSRFALQNGFLSSEFTSSPVAPARDGRIYALTQGGVLSFRPEQLHESSQVPAVAIAALSTRGEYGERQLPPDSRELQLGWNDRGLKVVARALSYVDPGANRYRFQLQGLDEHWVDVDDRGEREFSGLRAGDYQLRIMAAGAEGGWGELAQPLTVHVAAPPWMRWWAWLGYAGLVTLLGWLALRAWRRRLSQRHAMQLAEQRRQLAEQANAAKTVFLATLSHEIRTPMTGVLGMAELLLATSLDVTQHDYARTIQRSGDMLLRLLNDALDLARIEAGRMTLERDVFSPRALLEEVAALERALAQVKGLQWQQQLAADLPDWVAGDVVRVRQILFNLVGNALKFTERGTVTLAARCDGAGLLFSVSDTGPGIPEAVQARLFQPFEQGAGPQRHAGSGLGLAICRELAALMGGSIELISRVAHGSTFHLRLPLRAVDAPPGCSPPTPIAPTNRQEGSRRVLLVDADAIVAAVIRGMLEGQGHQVSYVSNGLLALAELSSEPFDLLLLDLELPGLDGMQLARIVRERLSLGDLPILALSGRADEDTERCARAAGIDRLLAKPLSGEQLAGALAALLAADAVAAVS